jgi:hypothetical protein
MTYKAAAGSGLYRPDIEHNRLLGCETCKHIDKTSYRHYYCTFAKEELDGDELVFLARVGCASHSDHQNFPSSRDLLLISHDEWKRREERKHIHEEIAWTHGWISGFLTSKKFVQERLAELHQENKDGEQE